MNKLTTLEANIIKIRDNLMKHNVPCNGVLHKKKNVTKLKQGSSSLKECCVANMMKIKKTLPYGSVKSSHTRMGTIQMMFLSSKILHHQHRHLLFLHLRLNCHQ